MAQACSERCRRVGGGWAERTPAWRAPSSPILCALLRRFLPSAPGQLSGERWTGRAWSLASFRGPWFVRGAQGESHWTDPDPPGLRYQFQNASQQGKDRESISVGRLLSEKPLEGGLPWPPLPHPRATCLQLSGRRGKGSNLTPSLHSQSHPAYPM